MPRPPLIWSLAIAFVPCVSAATSAVAQCQAPETFHITQDDSEVLGWNVSLDGDRLLVGVPRGGCSSGSAYVYGASGGEWIQLAELPVSGASSCAEFGYSVWLRVGLERRGHAHRV